MKFGLIGAAGYIAPRHMKAIKDLKHELVAAVDPSDSVGILDSYFPQCQFFTEIERFDRHIELLKRNGEGLDYISVCSPNYLHDAHIRMALRAGANAICEKPLVISPWNLEPLEDLEKETGKKVFTVFQSRLHPQIAELKRNLGSVSKCRHIVKIKYISRRGPWYQVSWKGNEEKSGGIAMNIGIHFFDLVLWLFGNVEHIDVASEGPERMVGWLELERASVEWELSTKESDLPAGISVIRSMTVDGREIDFATKFTDLHTLLYQDILAGNGLQIVDVRPSIELVNLLRKKK